jgi:hypothetical protein
VRALAGALERLRGASLGGDVPVERQSVAGFRAFVTRALDRTLPPAEAEARSKALAAFGLVARGYDLRKALLDLYVSQAGAYYDPAARTFFLLDLALAAPDRDALIVHELAHALQDRRFGLAAALERARIAGNDDAESALLHLIEGEATYLMTEARLDASGLAGADRAATEEVLAGRIRDLDRPALVASAAAVRDRLGPAAKDVKAAIDALAGVPDVLFWSLYSPYTRGAWEVHRTRAAGGWAAVDALFARPPASTEQVLHPEKALAEPRDEPVAVSIPGEVAAALEPEWRLVRENTLGELGTRIFLATFSRTDTPQAADRAAAGWGGDRYAVFERKKDGALALVWRTAWDTESDAVEFEEALRALGRTPLGKAGPAIRRRGREVSLVDAPDVRDRIVRAEDRK